MVLTAFGLAIDIVGAWVLAVGLFRGQEAVPLFPGAVGVRERPAVVKDRTYGVVGGFLLTAGFLFQFLGDLGVGPPDDRDRAVMLGLGGLAAGSAMAAGLLPAVWCVWDRLTTHDPPPTPWLDEGQP